MFISNVMYTKSQLTYASLGCCLYLWAYIVAVWTYVDICELCMLRPQCDLRLYNMQTTRSKHTILSHSIGTDMPEQTV